MSSNLSLERFWQSARFQPEILRVALPSKATAELRRLVFRDDVYEIDCTADLQAVPLRDAIEEFGRRLLDESGVLVIEAVTGLEPRQRQAAMWLVANCFGEPLVQDSDGNRQIHVYDRDRSRRMAHGARYHQTREGGSLHTDNVNMPDAWEFLVFGCVEPALIGGETVLAHGELVHDLLAETAPEALAMLCEPYWWEYRGIADALYEAPIITYDEQQRPHYRYLRPYLESAHQKAEQPLTERQSWALDVLDSAMELGRMQLRLTLQAGEILVTDDSRILHGRTSFADHFESTTVADFESQPERKIRRSFERAWVKRRIAQNNLPLPSLQSALTGADAVQPLAHS